MGWYARLVTNHPWLPILVSLSIAAICGPIGFWYAGIPDWSSPYKGLSPKGTSIQGRDQANVKFTTNVLKGIFTDIPGENGTQVVSSDSAMDRAVPCSEEDITGVTVLPVPPTLRATGAVADSTALPRIVAQPVNPTESLWTAQHMKDMCVLINTYITDKLHPSCEPFSLPYYIQLLRGGKNCSDLMKEDMDETLAVIQRCAQHYFDGILKINCQNTTCRNIPSECSDRNIVFYIFHYFTDKDFIKNGSTSETHLRYSPIIFRRSWNISIDDMYDYYKNHLGEHPIHSGLVEVKAIDIDILFGKINSDSVLSDIPFFMLAMALVCILLFIYLRSLALMAVVMGNVSLTILLGYFLYNVVFQIPYFSFVNILIGLLLIAISADGVFIFHDVFHKIKDEAPDPESVSIEDVLSQTLRHGFLSILVTSLTTSAAIYSNSISNIVALRGFGIFGGTCMLVNIFYLMALVPSVLVIIEKVARKYPKTCCGLCKCCKCECVTKCKHSISKFVTYIWSKVIPTTIIKGAPVWIILLVGLAAFGFVTVFYTPQLQLPSSEEIQVFYTKHPLEVYRLELREEFRFEIDFMTNRPNIEVKFIFGVNGEDNSVVFDPDDNGVLVFDDTFDIYPEPNQLWMKSFCRKLLQDELLFNSSLYNCFMDIMESVVTSTCTYPQINVTLDTRCCSSQFPLSESNAQFCLGQSDFIKAIHASVADQNQLIGLPIYNNRELISIYFTVQTNRVWKAAHDPMKELYSHFDSFMQDEILNAPLGLKQSWFTGAYGQEFYFYDLQLALLDGVISGIALSMSVSFLIMILTSRNILISLYAIINIVFVIAVTTASLVLLGWELGVTEALTITIAIGLSIDFTIHLGIGFKVSPLKTRQEKITDTISTVGFAVAMAAVTTFVAGTAMMGGKLVSYFRFGLFLMLNMTISWFYAMFFFMSVLRFIGPTGNVGNLSAIFKYIASCCKSKENSPVVAKDIKYKQKHNNGNTNWNQPKPEQEPHLRSTNNRKNKQPKHEHNLQENHNHHNYSKQVPHLQQQHPGQNVHTGPTNYVYVSNNGQSPTYYTLPAQNSYLNSGYEYYNEGQIRLSQFSSAVFDPRSKRRTKNYL